jgi:hypothetical protein
MERPRPLPPDRPLPLQTGPTPLDVNSTILAALLPLSVCASSAAMAIMPPRCACELSTLVS